MMVLQELNVHMGLCLWESEQYWFWSKGVVCTSSSSAHLDQVFFSDQSYQTSKGKKTEAHWLICIYLHYAVVHFDSYEDTVVSNSLFALLAENHCLCSNINQTQQHKEMAKFSVFAILLPIPLHVPDKLFGYTSEHKLKNLLICV